MSRLRTTTLNETASSISAVVESVSSSKDMSTTLLSRLPFSVLWHVDLSENNFKGPMTSAIGGMIALQELLLSENNIDWEEINPVQFSSLRQLREFSIRNTNHGGTLPDFVSMFIVNNCSILETRSSRERFLALPKVDRSQVSSIERQRYYRRSSHYIVWRSIWSVKLSWQTRRL
jgi:hypothetical protein